MRCMVASDDHCKISMLLMQLHEQALIQKYISRWVAGLVGPFILIS